ncbi:hypothetical protein [Sphingomonas oleivorans]|uniref:hypothetical protein n=1 Tax=Sphingomonas oleivorans TaxID=1735121 RepID=UPI001FB0450F|nr:hypothetical protein [Sphingomonas oleivorans]
MEKIAYRLFPDLGMRFLRRDEACGESTLIDQARVEKLVGEAAKYGQYRLRLHHTFGLHDFSFVSRPDEAASFHHSLVPSRPQTPLHFMQEALGRTAAYLGRISTSQAFGRLNLGIPFLAGKGDC